MFNETPLTGRRLSRLISGLGISEWGIKNKAPDTALKHSRSQQLNVTHSARVTMKHMPDGACDTRSSGYEIHSQRAQQAEPLEAGDDSLVADKASGAPSDRHRSLRRQRQWRHTFRVNSKHQPPPCCQAPHHDDDK